MDRLQPKAKYGNTATPTRKSDEEVEELWRGLKVQVSTLGWDLEDPRPFAINGNATINL